MRPTNVRALSVGVVITAALLCSGGDLAAAAPSGRGDDLYVRRLPPRVPADPGNPGVAAAEGTRVLGRVVTRGEPMPITGGDVAGLAAIGLGAVATGSVLLRRARRPPG